MVKCSHRINSQRAFFQIQSVQCQPRHIHSVLSANPAPGSESDYSSSAAVTLAAHILNHHSKQLPITVISDNTAIIRHNCDLPHISTVIDQYHLNFVNKLLDNNYLTCLFMIWFDFSCNVHCVSKKRHWCSNVQRTHQPIFVIFGRDVAEIVC